MRLRTALERGSVTIVVGALLVIAAVLGAGVARLGSVVVARAEVETAADAAALAAADMLALGRGSSEALDAAHETAGANGARVVRCTCTGRVVEVVVERRLEVAFGVETPLRGVARAEIRPIWPEIAR